jgi:membrane-bound lytic murein transglycosylase B
MKFLCKGIIILTVLFPSASFCDHSYFEIVKNNLIKEGFNKEYINRIYSSNNITYEFNSVTLFFTVSEYKLDYDKFLGKEYVVNGIKYINRYKKTFDYFEEQFSVPPEIITAILTIETRLGSYTGNRPVLSSLSSVAALKNDYVKKMVKKSVPSGKNRYSGKKFNDRADKRAKWAYSELKKFIAYCIENDIEPVQITGSYAGAVGIPQFMPSNISAYGEDGNFDGKKDLHNHNDAIASVAKYLKKHGWKKNISDGNALSVILKYNKSMPYAQTVLKLSSLLKIKENGYNGN